MLSPRTAPTGVVERTDCHRKYEQICQALKDAGKYERAWMVEFASMEGQRILKLSDVSEGRKPYFSIIVVHGEGRRP